MGPLLASSLSLYRLRALEPLLGSKKFSAFAAVTSALALPFEATAGVYFGTVRLTPGPIPLVFAMLVVYYAIVPPSKPRYFGALGMDFSDKAFTFAVAGMLASCEGWDSIVPAVCGALVGGLYMMDTMSIQALRLPGVVYRCFSKLCRPFGSSPRRGGGGSFFGGGSGPPPARRTMRRPSRAGQALLGPGRGRGGGLFSFFTPAQQGSTRLRAPPSLPPPSEETVTSLMGMGFDRSAVLQALQQTGNDSYAAVNLLVARGGGGSAPGSSGDAGARGGRAGAPGLSPGGGGFSSEDPHHRHASLVKMTTARKLEYTSRKLRVTMSDIIAIDGDVAALAAGVADLPQSEAAPRVEGAADRGIAERRRWPQDTRASSSGREAAFKGINLAVKDDESNTWEEAEDEEEFEHETSPEFGGGAGDTDRGTQEGDEEGGEGAGKGEEEPGEKGENQAEGDEKGEMKEVEVGGG
eukprot:g13989.t1